MSQSYPSILLVDDDDLVLGITSGILTNLGYSSVETATSGEAALAKISAAAASYNLAICDLNMPGMDGIELLKKLDVLQFSGSLILMSGEDSHVLQMAYDIAREGGLNILGAVTKPVTPVTLQELIKLLPNADFDLAAAESNADSGRQGHTHIDPKGAQAPIPSYGSIVHLRSGEIASLEVQIEGAREIHLLCVIIEQQIGLLKDFGDYIKFSIGIPVELLSDKSFVEQIIELAGSKGSGQSRFTFCVNGDALLSNLGAVREALMHIRFKRIGLAAEISRLDLVGLERLPITELRITPTILVQALQDSTTADSIAKFVAAGRKNKIELTAMGVESLANWKLIEKAGFDYALGSFCGTNMALNDIHSHIESWAPPPRR